MLELIIFTFYNERCNFVNEWFTERHAPKLWNVREDPKITSADRKEN
jgi:hypothetical protein